MKLLSIEEAARIMGMKPHREVREVVATTAGNCVRTHDGQWTLIHPDGKSMTFQVPAPVAPGGFEVELTGEPGAAPPADADEVPDGSVDAVLAWVNKDPEAMPGRALLALDVERAKPSPRATLVRELEKLKG
jgi:hypothetical protein